HSNARTAALAAEGAADQGRFEAYHDALFARQQDLGRRSWEEFARDAGLPDVWTFTRCLADKRYSSRVDRDVAIGKRIQISGTPTLIINGILYARPPTLEELERIVQGVGE